VHKLRQRARGTGTRYAPLQGMSWRRSTALRRIVSGLRGYWLSFLARDGPPALERTERFCERCGADTPHDTSDDFGYGRYAQMWRCQMWRCRHCGRETVRVWPLGF
jgi:hypothetical protein